MATPLHKNFKKFTSERIHLVRSAMALHVKVNTNSYCKSFGHITELRFCVNVPFITVDPFALLKIKILSLRGYGCDVHLDVAMIPDFRLASVSYLPRRDR